MANKKLLFVYTRLSAFVKNDIEVLEKEYRVTLLCIDNTTKARQIYALVRQFFYLLFNIYKFDLVYIWFADYHSFLPIFFAKLFRKRSYIVVAGYSVCRIKKLKYGSFINPVRGFMTKYSFNNTTLNLCVSRHIQRVLKYIAPLAKTEILYDGVSFTSSITRPKDGTILSVAIASTDQTFYIKGIDRYLEAARAAKDLNFAIVGLDKDSLSHLIGVVPDNLVIIPKVPHEELEAYFAKAQVYCQLSRSESFANALAEAMYHNCTPVITNVGGMPEVVGDFGYKVKGDDPAETVAAIRSALKLQFTEKYRERIIEKFVNEVRTKFLLSYLERGL